MPVAAVGEEDAVLGGVGPNRLVVDPSGPFARGDVLAMDPAPVHDDLRTGSQIGERGPRSGIDFHAVHENPVNVR